MHIDRTASTINKVSWVVPGLYLFFDYKDARPRGQVPSEGV